MLSMKKRTTAHDDTRISGKRRRYNIDLLDGSESWGVRNKECGLVD